MARLPRVVIPGVAHYVWLRGHSGAQVCADDVDRQAFLRALREATEGRDVEVHALALLAHEVHLLLRPHAEAALARAMQTLGRRYVAAYNRRHGRSGTLWDGRYRAAVIEPGEFTLLALRRIDALDASWHGEESAEDAPAPGASRPIGWLRDPPEFWALGNTPFEREASYRDLVAQPLSAATELAFERALRGGWALGSAAYVSQLAQALQRPLQPRPRGRPAGRQTRRPAAA